jgi:hypothetical protein
MASLWWQTCAMGYTKIVADKVGVAGKLVAGKLVADKLVSDKTGGR